MKIDWHNKEQVCLYAKQLGKGQVVYKHPNRDNFNITHATRKDLYMPEWVVLYT